MRGTIDRFEEGFAVVELENREMINIKRDGIPREAKEGDVLDLDGENISINHEETERRKKEIEKMMEDLFEE